MQDILPPSRPKPKDQHRIADKSLRLRGHTINDARSRLRGGDGAKEQPSDEYQTHETQSDDLSDIKLPPMDQQISNEPNQKKRRLRRPRPMDWWRAWSKKRKIITSLVVLVLIAGASAGAVSSFFWRTTDPDLIIVKHPKKVPPPPTTVASPLTGVQVNPEEAKRPVTGIMIENSPDARPQSGIDQAGVVYEAIAEGGITRFLTLYQEARPAYIGPVRSLRPYYLDFLVPFDASIAHVGGSPEALAQVRNGMKDLDQFFNSGSYWRVSSRYAPHNVYTSFDKMDALNQAKGYTVSNFTPWARKADKPLVKTVPATTPGGKATIAPAPTVTKINLTTSSFYYNSHYDYDAASNTYLRSEGGASHNATTSESDRVGAQLHPKVVVGLVMPYSIVDSAGHSGYNTNGSGPAYIFQDGGVTVGTWTKAGRAGQISFKDSAGSEVKLNTGQVWLTLLADTGKINYSL